MIAFNKPYLSGKEKKYIAKVLDTNSKSEDVISACEAFLRNKYGFQNAFLTNSCTTALEIAALLIDIKEGDEVIIPTYTYVSTATAFALRGAKIIFADSKPDHPNMDESQIEKLITNKTKAIVVVHYGGVSVDFLSILEVARKYNLFVIEDAAQCIDAFYKNSALGTIADIACFSFHETKNIHCGTGGFIAINNKDLADKAESIRYNGTNKAAFKRGEVKRYEWTSLGSSTIPSFVSAAFLLAQLESIDKVQKRRLKLWNYYYKKLKSLQQSDYVQLPIVPNYASNNAHIFYLICSSGDDRDRLQVFLSQNGIQSSGHFLSLYNSPFFLSRKNDRTFENADKFERCLLRLPLFYELTSNEQDFICSKVIEFYNP
jgi:dTDP-4-amino-4,6-dideoxygalactose transaminase